MYSDEDIRRLRWQSRRGMLELDVLLVPFVDEVFGQLPLAEQACFERLLACEDQDLFVWFMQRELATDPDLARMVKMILDRVQPD